MFTRNCLLRSLTTFLLLLLLGPLPGDAAEPAPVPVLILDGRNNHDWAKTTEYLRAALAATGKFSVSVTTAPPDLVGPGPKKPAVEDAAYLAAKAAYAAKQKELKPQLDAAWAKWEVDFSKYKTVVLNYNGPDWPKALQLGFVDFVKAGGGVVIIHAANNGFPAWSEFNQMIGIGWRKGNVGKCLVVNQDGTVGECCGGMDSGHGSKHPFVVTSRKLEHPILKGFPLEWLHAKDELYHHMRGPGENVIILASALSLEKEKGSGLHEPVLWEVPFGKGRVIVCSLGHCWLGDTAFDALECVGFQTLLARSTEYTAAGKVSLPLPANFPTKSAISLASTSKSAATQNIQTSFAPLSPEAEKATFVTAPGMEIQCVASEPMVEEPVVAVWDGDGALYVAEMRSYMQDEMGTGTKTLKNGRIKRLVDTNGDGIMDQATVFADGLNLPRMILPLDHRIAVVETDSSDVWTYEDTNHDGISDKKERLFVGKPGDPGRSVEHQDSGLIWNIDNWIYQSRGNKRSRFTNGKWEEQPIHPVWAQWGLANDDEGRLFFSDNSKPALGFDLPRQYWLQIANRAKSKLSSGDPIDLGMPWDIQFLNAKNLSPTDDRGGVAGPVKTFTSICGQSIYRDSAVPAWQGNYFFCDPTIHVVRRAEMAAANGRITFSNAHVENEPEFLQSAHMLFRPVNTALAPDGSLLVVDMYRGIIQDAPWLSPEPRKFLKESGLAGVHQHGRLWRVKQTNVKLHEAPRMLSQTTAELVPYLAHENGWWRDTAQRLIILRSDRDVAKPALTEMAKSHAKPLARLHALWTLDGLGAAQEGVLSTSLHDADARVRAAAVMISENRLVEMQPILLELAKTEPSGDVARQIILSLGCSTDKSPALLHQATDAILRRHLAHEGVTLAACVTLWKNPSPLMKQIQAGRGLASVADETERAAVATRWNQGFAQWQRGLNFPPGKLASERQQIEKGEILYFQTCVACHGPDGKGTQVPGSNQAIAPPLAGSSRVKGPADRLLPVLLNGLLGPIDGKAYQAAMMPPAATLGITRDDRLAELVSFIRYAWGNEASVVTTEEVKQARKLHAARTVPWTDDELKNKP